MEDKYGLSSELLKTMSVFSVGNLNGSSFDFT